MVAKHLPFIQKAQKAKQLIRFSHRFESYPIRGYVLDIGPKFFLMAIVCDRIWFDGFECFRLSDVSKVMIDPYARFAETALRKRRERIPKKPRISVASVEELIMSAGQTFPLVTIYREKIDPGVVWIGKILGFEQDHVSLLEINPDANWENKRSKYHLKEITRVGFGGDYETALDLVAKKPDLHRLKR